MINIGHTSIRFASPEMIRHWALRKLPNGQVIGEVTNPKPFNIVHKNQFLVVFFEAILAND